jgi:hypothetical protein
VPFKNVGEEILHFGAVAGKIYFCPLCDGLCEEVHGNRKAVFCPKKMNLRPTGWRRRSARTELSFPVSTNNN